MPMKMLEIVSNLDHLSEARIKSALMEHASSIKKWLYILHDKDTLENGTLKAPHYHVYLNFGSTSWSFEAVSKWFNLAPQFCSRIKGRYSDAVSYAVHKNAPEKFQYSLEECHASFDVQGEIEAGERAKIKGREAELVDEYCQKIINGEIKEFQLSEIPGLIYVHNRTRIESAFKYRLELKKSEVNRKMDVLWFWGPSGSGKTTFAKHICEDNGWSYCVSSGSNDILQDYRGQQVLILDDLRPSSLGLSDLLKMLDNNTGSSVKARYVNRWLECEKIIITTVLPLDVFFSAVFKEQEEPKKQLARRCQSVYEFRDNEIDLFGYDELSGSHKYLSTFPNFILAEYRVKNSSPEERLTEALSLLGRVGDGLKKMAKNAPVLSASNGWAPVPSEAFSPAPFVPEFKDAEAEAAAPFDTDSVKRTKIKK